MNRGVLVVLARQRDRSHQRRREQHGTDLEGQHVLADQALADQPRLVRQRRLPHRAPVRVQRHEHRRRQQQNHHRRRRQLERGLVVVPLRPRRQHDREQHQHRNRAHVDQHLHHRDEVGRQREVQPGHAEHCDHQIDHRVNQVAADDDHRRAADRHRGQQPERQVEAETAHRASPRPPAGRPAPRPRVPPPDRPPDRAPASSAPDAAAAPDAPRARTARSRPMSARC